MNAGVSEIDGQEQAAARLNEIVEELPIVEHRGTNDILLPESNSMVSVFFSTLFKKKYSSFLLTKDFE